MGSMGEVEINEVDVLLVGAGFGAATMLKKLLDKGFDVKVYEKGTSFGGMLESRSFIDISYLFAVLPQASGIGEQRLMMPNA